MSTLHRVESPAFPGDVPKQSLDGGFRPEEYEFDSEATAPRPHDAFPDRFRKRFASRHPRLYSRTIQVLVYCRGPRPKIEFSGSWLSSAAHTVYLSGVTC